MPDANPPPTAAENLPEDLRWRAKITAKKRCSWSLRRSLSCGHLRWDLIGSTSSPRPSLSKKADWIPRERPATHRPQTRHLAKMAPLGPFDTPTTRMEIRTWRSAIADLRTQPPGAPSGALGAGTPGWVWRCDAAISRYHQKNAFLYVFHVQPKHQKDAIFVNIEDFRPCLSKPSYRAPKWALMVRLMQKERLKSPQKSLIIENQAFWVIFGHFGQNSHLGHFGQPFPRQGGHADKKAPLGVLLKST